MSAWDQVSCYCERGLDAGFWAEPLNAVSNIAFLVAALMAYSDFRAARPERGGGAILALILLLMVIGAGSFLFHTYATVWARAADALSTAAFTLVYLYLALRWFLGLGLIVSLGAAIAVAVLAQLMPPWFNGSFGYAPALLSMLIVGIWLAGRRHGAARWVLAAGCVFTVSLTFRTIDAGAGCLAHPPGVSDPAFMIGTHVFWHILNAVTLYLLLRAAIENPPARE